MRVIALLILLNLPFAAAQAKNLYVDAANGNDSVTYANNDINNPWQTIGRAAWGSLARIAPVSNQAAQAGDIVLVAAGTYSALGTNTRYIPAFNPVNSGNATDGYITFRAQGRVVLQTHTEAGPTFGADNRSYIKWDGFYVDEANAQPAADTGSVTIFGGDHIIIENCTIQGRYQTWADNHNGIRFEGTTNSIARNNVIRTIRNSSGSNPNHYNFAGIMLYSSGNIIMEGNEISDSGSGIFIKGHDNYSITARHNYIHDFGNVGIRVSYSGAGGPINIYQNLIRDGESGLNLAEFAVNTNMVNNTVYNVLYGYYLGAYDGQSNNVLKNNIVANATTRGGHFAYLPAGETTAERIARISIDNTLYYWVTAYSLVNQQVPTLSGWQSLISDEANSLYENPGFVNENIGDFRLSNSSPAVNAGVDVLDLNNNGSTTDPISIGAYITGLEQIGPPNIRPLPPTSLVILP